MTQINNEIELKFITLSEKHLHNVFNLDVVKKHMIKRSKKTKMLETRYYDTPNKVFAKNKIVYRIRKDEDTYVATVKSENKNRGSLSERMEYNAKLSSNKPSFTNFSSDNFLIDLPTLVENEGEVEELFCVSVKREQCEIRVTKKTILELSVDIGKIIASDKESVPIAEIELEILEGDTKDLLKYISLLAVELPLYAEEKSKFVKGCELINAPIELTPNKPFKKFSIDQHIPQVLNESLKEEIAQVLSSLRNLITMCNKETIDTFNEKLISLQMRLTLLSSISKKKQYDEYKLYFNDIIELNQKYLVFYELVNTYSMLAEKYLKEADNTTSKIFLQKQNNITKKIKKIIKTGTCSAKLYSLWMLLEKNNKVNKNVEISTKTFIKERNKHIIENMLQKNDIEYIENENAFSIIALLKYLDLKKEKKLKQTHKRLDKVIDLIQKKSSKEQIIAELTSSIQPYSHKLVHRESGILLGWYLNKLQLVEKKLAKKSKKLIKKYRK